MQYLSTAYQNAYQYFFQQEPEVDYTGIPSHVKDRIESHYKGSLTNKEKQEAVNDYKTTVDKDLVKDVCDMSKKLISHTNKEQLKYFVIRANERSEKYNNRLQNSSKEITTQGQGGMLSTVKRINVPMGNKNCDDEVVEFNAYS